MLSEFFRAMSTKPRRRSLVRQGEKTHPAYYIAVPAPLAKLFLRRTKYVMLEVLSVQESEGRLQAHLLIREV